GQQEVAKLQEQLAAQTKDSEQKAQQLKQLQQTVQENQQASAKLQEQLAAQTKDSEQKAVQVKQLQQTVQESQQANTKLQEQLAAQTKDNEQKSQQVKQLQQGQQALATLQEQLAAQTKDSEQKAQQLAQQQQTLQENQQTNAKLQEQLAAQTKDNEQKAELVKQLQQTAQENQQASAKLQEQLAAQTKDSEQQAQALKQLQQALADAKKTPSDNVATVAVPEPKTDQEKRDYAIGTSLGSDIVSLLESKKSQGVDVNRQLALAGVADTLNGQIKMNKEQIAKALYESELELNNQHKQLKTKSEQAGKKYIEKFKKQPRVVKSPQGFYYRVDYKGDGNISEADTVAVVVKESLTDGKVIKDMDLAGTSISQPLSAYPPLFREAISKLKNHGSMTLVVPPELAYGDKGMAPDIPPGATMVYTVRILDVMPTSSTTAAH
ncbi:MULTISPECIES: FKBP-type peptidyl-prolyl cis-trans isomerase N-terminal domain-containing protein, partial [unclassified Serratia (in: enterobacteria)]